MIDKLAAARFSALAAAGLSIASFAAPASAAEQGSDKVASSKVALSAAATVTARPAEKKYCVVDTFTGSRLAKKVCKTQREWSEEGVDIASR